jgi:histidine triad (HIT) family protein
MTDCIFCKIVSKKIPVEPLAEYEGAILIRDKNPIAPHHVLAIAKEHVSSIHELDYEFTLLEMLALLCNYAEQNKLNESGYRIVINTGKDAGQTVPHFHAHLVGGATLKNDFGA